MNIAERFRRMYELGCICCLENVENYTRCFREAQIHHLTDKGTKKLSGGDAATVPCCPWHHQGLPMAPYNEEQTKRMLGPSLRLHKREFVATYGAERALLARVNELLGETK